MSSRTLAVAAAAAAVSFSLLVLRRRRQQAEALVVADTPLEAREPAPSVAPSRPPPLAPPDALCSAPAQAVSPAPPTVVAATPIEPAPMPAAATPSVTPVPPPIVDAPPEPSPPPPPPLASPTSEAEPGSAEPSPTSVVDAKPPRRRKPRAAPPTPAAAPAAAAPSASAQPSLVEVMMQEVMQRSVLSQPTHLAELAAPPLKSPKEAAVAKGGKELKRKKAPVLSSWAEVFIEAMRRLDENAPLAVSAAKALLDQALASAEKPGAPAHAPALTLRGLGFLHAAVGEFQQAAIAYIRALGQAERLAKAGALGARGLALLLGCHRDLAVLLHELGRHADASKQWAAALALVSSEEAAAAALAWPPPLAPAPPCAPLSAACSDLLLCLADSELCVTAHKPHAQALASAALDARAAHYGRSHPATVAAVYELARITRALAAEPAPAADRASAALRAEARALASALDCEWLGALRGLCAGEQRLYSDQLALLGQVASIHREHAEASHLYELALANYPTTPLLLQGKTHKLEATHVHADGAHADAHEGSAARDAEQGATAGATAADAERAPAWLARVSARGSLELVETIANWTEALTAQGRLARAALAHASAAPILERAAQGTGADGCADGGATMLHAAPLLAAAAELASVRAHALVAPLREARARLAAASSADGGAAGPAEERASADASELLAALASDVAAADDGFREALASTRAMLRAVSTAKEQQPAPADAQAARSCEAGSGFSEVEMVVQIHARVLKRYAQHLGRQADAAEAGGEGARALAEAEHAARAELQQLQLQFGFQPT